MNNKLAQMGRYNACSKACELMDAMNKVWDELGICCSWSSAKVGDSVEENKEAHDARLEEEIRKLGYSEKNPVPVSVRKVLEAEGYHTLNRVLQERKLGCGDY